MKNTLSFLLSIALLEINIHSAHSQTTTNSAGKFFGTPVFGHVMSITVTNPTLVVGSPIKLFATIKNVGNDKIAQVVPWELGFEYNVKVSFKGTMVPLTLKGQGNYRPPIVGATIDWLSQGEEYSFTLPLDDWFMMDQEGEYKISAIWIFWNPHNPTEWTNCVSNEIIMNVKK